MADFVPRDVKTVSYDEVAVPVVHNTWVPQDRDRIDFSGREYIFTFAGKQPILTQREAPTGTRRPVPLTEEQAALLQSFIGYPINIIAQYDYYPPGVTDYFNSRTIRINSLAWVGDFTGMDRVAIFMVNRDGTPFEVELEPGPDDNGRILLHSFDTVASIVTSPGRSDSDGEDQFDTDITTGLIELNTPIVVAPSPNDVGRTVQFKARVVSSIVEPEFRDFSTGELLEPSVHRLSLIVDDRLSAGLGDTPSLLSSTGAPQFDVEGVSFRIDRLEEVTGKTVMIDLVRA